MAFASQGEPEVKDPGLAAPVALQAGGELIDAVVGHAAPHMFDVDGDGLRDLLVGEFGRETFDVERLPEDPKLRSMGFANSQLRVYRNIGTNAAPAYGSFEYLPTVDGFASIPST